MPKLEPTDVHLAMTALSGWTLDIHPQRHMACLSKSWTLPNFEMAVARFNQIAQLAKAQDHHPEVLSQNGLKSSGSAQLSRYNPPWTLPFWRRNEVWVKLDN